MQLISQAKATHPQVALVWADPGFKNKAVEHAAGLGVTMEIVARKSDEPGFHVVKRRWVVERTIGWLMLHRRLARDYETTAESSRAMINLAMIDNTTKRITSENTRPGTTGPQTRPSRHQRSKRPLTEVEAGNPAMVHPQPYLPGFRS